MQDNVLKCLSLLPACVWFGAPFSGILATATAHVSPLRLCLLVLMIDSFAARQPSTVTFTPAILDDVFAYVNLNGEKDGLCSNHRGHRQTAGSVASN